MNLEFFLSAAGAAFTPDLLIPTLNNLLVLLVATVVGLTFYAYLIDRAVFDGLGRVRSERFGPVDALLALLLITFFSLIVWQAVKSSGRESSSEIPDAREIVQGSAAVAVLFLVFITVILAALRLRAISWRDTFGLTQVSLPGILGRAVLLLLLAYPLIAAASDLSEFFLTAGGDKEDSAQDMVRFFAHSDAAGAKWVVAVSAVIIAPMQEEFLFRGYIYGVVRRYGGVMAGVLFNSVLFAAIHVHLPSFAPLFVLAVCLTLAYEWTGSIWVPMCMHALFNSTTVVSLLLGGKVS